MKLTLENIGKKYNRQWLFKGITINLESGDSLAITGVNGAGKSTLLQIIFGLIQPSEGIIRLNGKEDYNAHLHFSIASPYMELPNEFSIREIRSLHEKLGKLNMSENEFLTYARFDAKDALKPVKLFSSGMTQRLKTALCMASLADIILLDEPLTNMDAFGEAWYKENLYRLEDKIAIVAGNNPQEYQWTNRHISIQ